MLGWNRLKAEYQKVKSLLEEVGEELREVAQRPIFLDAEPGSSPDSLMPTNGKVRT